MPNSQVQEVDWKPTYYKRLSAALKSEDPSGAISSLLAKSDRDFKEVYEDLMKEPYTGTSRFLAVQKMAEVLKNM